MTTSELIIDLKNLKDELKKRFGIEKIALFGSYARGEATEESDVDIVILDMQLKSGFDVIRAKNYLKEELGKEVDMGTFNSMKTFIKNRIKKTLFMFDIDNYQIHGQRPISARWRISY